VEGIGVHWDVHPGLTSVLRLRLVSYLEREGWKRGPEAARALSLPLTSVHQALNGLFDGFLLEKRAAAIGWPYSRSRTGGVYALEWRVSGRGAGWVDGFVAKTLELLPFLRLEEMPVTERGDVDAFLARDGQTALMRPARMAVAYRLVWRGACADNSLARELGMRRCSVQSVYRDFARRGWIEDAGAWFDAYGRFGYVRRRAPRYEFTMAGRAALEGHVRAVAGVRR
jgi:hypothetical protein